MQSALLVLMLTVLIGVPSIRCRHLKPVCSTGGMCSCQASGSHEQAYTGYLDEAAELKQALAAASYKKEVRYTPLHSSPFLVLTGHRLLPVLHDPPHCVLVARR